MVNGHSVVSDVDRQRLLRMVPDAKFVEVVPNGVDLSSFTVNANSKNPYVIIFTGYLKYGANMEGLRHFKNEIFPLIRKMIPDAKLRVTGDTSEADLRDLQTDRNIEFTGYLNDIRPAIASSSVSIAPLKVGGGTRLKILEAMALGTPVVSTTVGAEGIECKDGKDIFIADEPKEFARKVVLLMQNRELAFQIARNARRLVEQKYGWKSIAEKMNYLIEGVVEDFRREPISSAEKETRSQQESISL